MKGITLLTILLLLIDGCSQRRGYSSATERQKTDSLIALANNDNFLIDTEHSLRHSLEALELAQSSGYRKGIAESCFYISLALYNIGNYDKSIEYVELGEKYVDGDPKLTSEFIRVKARIYSYLGLQEKAKAEFLKGLSCIQKIKQPEQRQFLTALAYENLGHLYAITEKSDSAFYYIQKKIALLDSMDEARVYTIRINAYTSMGKFHTYEMNYDSAAVYFDRSIAMADKYDYRYRSRAYMSKGDMYLKINNADSAMYYYRLTLDNLAETGLKAEYSLLYEKMADTYLLLGDTTAARQYKSMELEVEKELNDEKLKTAKIILDTLSNKEKELKQAHRKEFYFLGTVILLLLALIVSIYLFIRQKITKYKEKEQEIQELKLKVNESFTEIVELGRNDDPTFMVRFQEVYPEFTHALGTKYPHLQLSELHLLALIYLQFTTKEIADCTCRSVRTVQNRKYQLRKKLGIATNMDMNVWLHETIQQPPEE
ncbi:tetratricopeptide repeat protein [Proteiniphilum sp. UBA5384]|uniref:tetratricopeptide repeat protein n=1 Tax=Proteiniphilum sp. UBA5384 TaxID=1947279 RepID=UPI0025EDB2F3|nr:hypothetical protein [Proteiniphilum sp. UBA5384]